MELASALLKVVGSVSPTPALSCTCSLVAQVIDSIQTSEDNAARLQRLSQRIIECLIRLAEQMDGHWERASDSLKKHVDEFEAFLRDILRMVKRYKKQRRGGCLNILRSRWREIAITRLETRLAAVERAFMLAITVNSSITLSELRQVVHSQGEKLNDTLRMMEDSLSSPLTRKVSPEKTGSAIVLEEELHTAPSRLHFHLGRTIMQLEPSAATTVRICLREARSITGALHVMKTFEGKAEQKRQEFELGLRISKFWTPTMLQFIAASSKEDDIPFQLFHAVGNIQECFLEWLERTMNSNIVETIYGIFSMRHSIHELLLLQEQHGLKFTGNLANSSLVRVEKRGRRFEWCLTYTGGIGEQRFDHDHERECWERGICICETGPTPFLDVFRSHSLVDNYMKRNQYNYTLVAEFLYEAAAWNKSEYDLEALTGQPYETMSLQRLGESLISRGWLGPCNSVVETNDTLGLGVLGYTRRTHNGNLCFSILADSHENLTIKIPAITWGLQSGWTDIPETDEVEHFTIGGRKYTRYIYREWAGFFTSESILGYSGLSNRDAWNFLNEEVEKQRKKISSNIGRSDIQFVTSFSFEWRGILSDHAPDTCCLANPQRCKPVIYPGIPIYVFVQEEGWHYYTEDCRRPVISKQIRISFEEKPSWLKDEVWPLLTETLGQYSLYNGIIQGKKIEYYQYRLSN